MRPADEMSYRCASSCPASSSSGGRDICPSRRRRATSQNDLGPHVGELGGAVGPAARLDANHGDAQLLQTVDDATADAGLVDEDGGDAQGLGELADLVGEAHGVLALEGDEALDAVAAAEADDGLVAAEAGDVDAHAPGHVEVRAVAGRDEGGRSSLPHTSPRVAALAPLPQTGGVWAARFPPARECPLPILPRRRDLCVMFPELPFGWNVGFDRRLRGLMATGGGSFPPPRWPWFSGLSGLLRRQAYSAPGA